MLTLLSRYHTWRTTILGNREVPVNLIQGDGKVGIMDGLCWKLVEKGLERNTTNGEYSPWKTVALEKDDEPLPWTETETVGLERKGQMGESNRHNLLTDRIWEVGDKKDSTGTPGTWLWMRDDSGTPWEWGQVCKVKRWIWFGDLLGLKYLGIIPNIAGSETQETSLGLRWFVSINSGVLFRFVFKWVCIYSQTTGLTVA